MSDLTPTSALPLDELLWRLSRAMRHGELGEWERGFAASILGAARRRGDDWRPSEKQSRVLEGLVDGLRSPSLMEGGE